MERQRVLVGMVLVAAMGVGLVSVGCQTAARERNPYMAETGRKVQITDTPLEVQQFIKDAYPDAEVDSVYEMRHRKEYRMRHFEIHLVLAGGRKKTVEYNTFVKTTPNAQTLSNTEVKGSGTAPEAQPRGYSAGTGK